MGESWVRHTSCSISSTPRPRRSVDLFDERGWGDGLPLVPPTVERVDAMLDGVRRCDPDEVLSVLAASLRQVHPAHGGHQRRARRLHSPSHAGARHRGPRARRARAQPARRQRHHASGGAVADRARRDRRHARATTAALGAFGPGNRANATTGRAVRLMLVARRRGPYPARAMRRRKGSRRSTAYCVAENMQRQPVGQLRTAASASMRRRAQSPCTAARPRTTSTTWRPIIRGPSSTRRRRRWPRSAEQRANRRRASISSALGPEHAATIAAHRWTRRDVRATCTRGRGCRPVVTARSSARSPGSRGCTTCPTTPAADHRRSRSHQGVRGGRRGQAQLCRPQLGYDQIGDTAVTP